MNSIYSDYCSLTSRWLAGKMQPGFLQQPVARLDAFQPGAKWATIIRGPSPQPANLSKLWQAAPYYLIPRPSVIEFHIIQIDWKCGCFCAKMVVLWIRLTIYGIRHTLVTFLMTLWDKNSYKSNLFLLMDEHWADKCPSYFENWLTHQEVCPLLACSLLIRTIPPRLEQDSS